MSDGSSAPGRPPEGGAEEDASGSSSLGESILSWLRGLTRGNDEGGLKRSLEEAIEEHRAGGGALDPEQQEMLLNIVSFGELQVDDVMVPRADIVGIEVGATLDEVVQTFRAARHSRMPVYREALDDVIGFVHIKDVIDFWGDGETFALAKVVREILVVPPSMFVLDLLARMRATRIHMAVVIDEYGGTDGLVTVEDLVEEIVGEIEDEYDEGEGPRLLEQEDGSIEADARFELTEFEALYGVDLLPDETDEEVDTLGGLVVALMGRVPRRGERLSHDCGLEFEVVDADPRRVKRLKVRRLAADAPG